MLVVFYLNLFTDAAVAGWNVIAIMQLLFSGLILILIGVLGEYTGRIYDESKNRPLYIVQDCYGLKKKERKIKSVI
jgi:dolichol-phosphate mannosyltransferase